VLRVPRIALPLPQEVKGVAEIGKLDVRYNTFTLRAIFSMGPHKAHQF
jgi:hypothetical protein